MKYNLYILLVIFSLVACQKAPEMPQPSIKLDLEEISAPSFAVDYTVSISANVGWKITSNSVFEWVVPSHNESRGTLDLVLKISANESGEERSGNIVISSDDNTITKEIQISQRPATVPGIGRVREVRALERQGGYEIIQGKIRGFVVTDAESSNYFSNSFAIEDSFVEELSGITVTVQEDKYKAPVRGTEVEIDLAGARLERNSDGVLSLLVKENPMAGSATPLEITPDSLDVADLESGKYESMFVCLPACQVVEGTSEGVLASSPRLTDEPCEHFARLVVSADASFASESFGMGGGRVAGVVGALKNKDADIRPISGDDIKFGTKRLGERPGITQLPYVFSFYCSSQTDGASKYLKYNQLFWDSSTCLTSGKIAEEKDADIGASLWLTTYAKAASNVSGPNLWAEAGAHDNVNGAGFVSLDGKTTPPAECGWWLDIPLSMNMPENFTVTFGMGGAEWSLANWSVEYSKDKQTWYKGGDYFIDHKLEGGCYYLFFNIPIQSQISFVKDDVLHLKFVPKGRTGCGGSNNADGHGQSCSVRLHSAIIISSYEEGATPRPSNAVWFEPFDALTNGVDYFLGDKVAGLANYPGPEISAWTQEQKKSMGGSNVYARPGYAQIGFVDTERAASRKDYVNATGVLESPQLGVSGNVVLTFEAAAYRSPSIRANSSTAADVTNPDLDTAVIEILGDGTILGAKTAKISKMSVTKSFSTHSFIIEGVSQTTRIRFTSNPLPGEFSRWFIDNITVTAQ